MKQSMDRDADADAHAYTHFDARVRVGAGGMRRLAPSAAPLRARCQKNADSSRTPVYEKLVVSSTGAVPAFASVFSDAACQARRL